MYLFILCSNKHASLITKLSKPHKSSPWYTSALLALQSTRRHLERKYISTHSASDYKILCTITNQYDKLIARAKRQFNAQLIQSSISNPSPLKKYKLLTTSQTLPHYHLQYPNPSLTESFGSFKSDKVFSLHLKLSSNPSPIPPHSNPLLLIKSYHNLLLHLLIKLLNFCMPLLIISVILTLSPPSS